MTQTPKVVPFATVRSQWLTRLHTSCLLLETEDDDLVRSIDLTQRFLDASPQELEALASQARQVALEYRLSAIVITDGPWVTVTLAGRQVDQSAADGFTGHLSWLPHLLERMLTPGHLLRPLHHHR